MIHSIICCIYLLQKFWYTLAYSFWRLFSFIVPSVNSDQTFFPLTKFMPLVSFYTLWKYQKTRKFSDVFRGYRKKLVARNWLSKYMSASMLIIFNLFLTLKLFIEPLNFYNEEFEAIGSNFWHYKIASIHVFRLNLKGYFLQKWNKTGW